EYYRLTQILLTHGHLPVGQSFTGGYAGWGYAYPDFPGLFLLAGAGAGALGLSPFVSLTILVPVVTALSVLPLFLLFRRIYPHDTIAILGAALATVAMPRLFSIAHPAPLALGDLLAVAGLWLFLEGRRDSRWYVPLALVGGALIVTHHLSSYFFLLSALGALLLFELLRPGGWSRRLPVRELGFLAAFSVGLLLFWFDYATDFRGVLATGLPGGLSDSPVPFLVAAVVGFLAVGAILRWNRRLRSDRPFRVRFPSDRSMIRDGAIIATGVVVGLSVLLLVPLPATGQELTPGALLWFAPLILTLGLAAGSRRLVSLARLGPVALAWLSAIGLSALFALATNNAVLLPSRHAEYLLLPLGLLVAAVLGYLALRVEAVAGRRGLVAFGVAVTVLLAANAVIAYPPPADLGGFEEGLTDQDAALWMWTGAALPPTTVVVADHPLSSMLFGFDGVYATWQNAGAVFVGSNWSEAALALESVAAPHCPYRFAAQVVIVDSLMYGGVALDPSQPALPLSTAAQGWLAHGPFVPLYENGLQVVYW
ncbi:MAG: hypothetical protein ACREC5_05010, partial [Thermoplasmata archaeon]